MTDVIRTNPDDPLQRQVWSFTVHWPHITLNRYREETRQSNRHKWKAHIDWGGWDRRGDKQPVSIPPDVIEEVHTLLEAELRAGKLYIGGPWREENEHPKS